MVINYTVIYFAWSYGIKELLKEVKKKKKGIISNDFLTVNC